MNAANNFKIPRVNRIHTKDSVQAKVGRSNTTVPSGAQDNANGYGISYCVEVEDDDDITVASDDKIPRINREHTKESAQIKVRRSSTVMSSGAQLNPNDYGINFSVEVERDDDVNVASDDKIPRVNPTDKAQIRLGQLSTTVSSGGQFNSNDYEINYSVEAESDADGDVNVDNNDNIPRVNKNSKDRTFRATWLNDAALENWVKENMYPDRLTYPVICSICDLKLKVKSGKSDLMAHAKSNRLIQKSNSILMQPTISSKFQDSTKLKHQIMKAELQIAALTAEHNLSFKLSDHLTPMIKSACKDSKIAQNISCGRTKTGCLVKNVLGSQQYQQICDLLKHNKFSLCIDESTDVSTTKILSLVVRVSINYKVHDYFFELIEVVNTDAVTLYNKVVNVFIKNNINYSQNLIGFAADGANNMTGRNHSVAALLSKDCDNLIIMKCICHSFALCSSYAWLKLPSAVETMTRDIYNYVQNSSKRTHI